jgi:hypothetical protein
VRAEDTEGSGHDIGTSGGYGGRRGRGEPVGGCQGVGDRRTRHLHGQDRVVRNIRSIPTGVCILDARVRRWLVPDARAYVRACALLCCMEGGGGCCWIDRRGRRISSGEGGDGIDVKGGAGIGG